MFKVIAFVKNENLKRTIVKEIDVTKFSIEFISLDSYDYYTTLLKLKADVVLLDTEGLNEEYTLLNRLVATKKIIIYLSSKMELGLVYNLMTEPTFYILSDKKVSSLNDVLYLIIRECQIIMDLQDRMQKYKDKVEEDKLVKKAKLILMKEGLSEEEAYKKIQKLSMQNRKTKKEIALEILS